MRKRAAAFLTALAMMIAGAFSESAETPVEIGTAASSDPLAQ
ncbi:MAG: hypothetical protein Q4G19_05605 [Clostridia bacterium]|nr:hypothetical protein [Clostridia bacterium]